MLITLIIVFFIINVSNIVVFLFNASLCGTPKLCAVGGLEKMWKESVTLRFPIIPVSRHLFQGVKKTCTLMKTSDLWAEI
jgi:hypothetical protein